MKPYILDTRIFIQSRDYYPEVFPTFWENMNNAIKNDTVSSVDQVYEELKQYGGKQEHYLKWIKRHKRIFTHPTPDEQKKVQEIFMVPKFTEIIGKKQKLRGGAFADPFVIAKAIIEDSIVVTGELPARRNKQGDIIGAPKIPDVCKHFNVECITPEEFMKRLGWKF